MTGLIPRPFIDELLNRSNIVELIDTHVPLKKAGRNYVACCPFHQEKTPSFNVSDKKQFYHCFGCGVSGNAISFVMAYLHLDFVETIENLAGRLGLTVPYEGKAETKKTSPSLYELMEEVCRYYQQNLKQDAPEAVQYLKDRGLTGDIAALYRLGYAKDDWHALERQFRTKQAALIETGMLIPKEKGSPYDRYRNRISFPIHDRRGRIIGFGGRAIRAEEKPKYLNSPETSLFQKSKELYGLYQLLQYTEKPEFILVVEGYLDVIGLAQHGIRQVVATLGTATSQQHIQILSKYSKRIIFCFDGDQAGRQAAWRALEQSLQALEQGLELEFLFLPEGEDPDSLVRQEGQAAFLGRLQQAQNLSQFLFGSLAQEIDLGTMAGKAQLVNKAKPYLERVPESPFKELLLDELARRSHLEPHRLRMHLQSDTAKNSLGSESKFSRSPLRLCIALLLQHPELYPSLQAQIAQLQQALQQYPILSKLFTALEQNPRTNTARLIEYFRDTDLFEAFNKLAHWQHQVPEAALAKELEDILQFLAKKDQENTIKQLMEKSRQGSISPEERSRLQSLLQLRHQPAE